MQVRSQIVIVGTGFAGIGMAIRLKQAGIHDFVLLERGDDVGGTWRDNVYPGAACDVQSHLYSFSFAPNPDWSHKYAPQREILGYLRRCADQHALRPHLRLGTDVVEGRYDEARGLWQLTTRAGDSYEAQVLVSGCGAFNRPVFPQLPGLGEFRGPLLHTARWRDAPLAGKRVAVVGTGASAIQVVPELAREVQSLTLFQRTPPWILPKKNPPYSPRQKAWFRKLPLVQRLERAKIYAENELVALGFVLSPRLMKPGEALARRYLARKVSDPALRRQLTPAYTMGCKRVLLSSEYLDTLTREHVALVTDPIVEVRSDAIVTGTGRVHPVEAIVCATGFEVSENVAPFALYGRDGRELNESWQSGCEAYKGTTVKGFPNAFMLMGPNTGLGHNSMLLMIEAQIGYTLQAIQLLRRAALKSIEVRPEVQDRYNERLQARMARTVWSRGGCTSYYQTRTGKNTTLWPGFTFEFIARTRRFDPGRYRLEPGRGAP